MDEKPQPSSRDSFGPEVREFMKKQIQLRADKKRQEALKKKNEIEERRRKLDALRKVTREVAQKSSKHKISRVQTSEGTKAQPMKALPVVPPTKPKSPKTVAVAQNEESPNNDNRKQEPEVTKIKVFIKDSETRNPKGDPKAPAINPVFYNWPVAIEEAKNEMQVAPTVKKSPSTVGPPVESSIHSSTPEVTPTLMPKSSELMENSLMEDRLNVSDQYPLSRTTTTMEIFANQKTMDSFEKYNSPSCILDIGRSKELISKSSTFYIRNLSLVPSVMSEQPENNSQDPIVSDSISDNKASKHSIAISAPHFLDTATISEPKDSEHSVPEPKNSQSPIVLGTNSTLEQSIPETAPKTFLGKISSTAVAESSSGSQKSTATISTFKQPFADDTGPAEPVLMPLPESNHMTIKTFNSVTTQTETSYRETPMPSTVHRMAQEHKPTSHSFGHNYSSMCDNWKPEDCSTSRFDDDEKDKFCEQVMSCLKKKSNQFDDKHTNHERCTISPSTSSSSLSINSDTIINVPPPRQPPVSDPGEQITVDIYSTVDTNMSRKLTTST